MTLNKKRGFTIVELLAVVLIISILVMLAIFGISRYVLESRKKAFVEDAKTITSTAKTFYNSDTYTSNPGVSVTGNKIIYKKEAVDSILTHNLGTSPFNNRYSDAGVIMRKTRDEFGQQIYEYYVCLIDEGGNGFDYTSLAELKSNSISMELPVESRKCTDVPDKQYTINVEVIHGRADEPTKTIFEGEIATFNLTPNHPDMTGEVSCTNHQSAELSRNHVLTLNDVSSDTTCTVNYTLNLRTPASPENKIYNGEEQQSGITCPSGSTAKGDTKAINYGNYRQICEIDDKNSTKWDDDTTEDKLINWNINKRDIVIKAKDQNVNKASSISETINDVEVTNLATPDRLSSITLTPSTTSPTTSGALTPSNAKILNQSGSNATSNYNIDYQKGSLIIKTGLNAPAGVADKTYNGSVQASGIAACPTGSHVDGVQQAKDAGTYNQKCVLNSDTRDYYYWISNPSSDEVVIPWTIKKAASTNPTLSDTTATYDGNSHAIGVSGGSGGTINYRTSTDNSTWGSWSGTKPSLTNVGKIYVQAYVKGDGNHNDTSATGSKAITITQREVTVTAPSMVSGTLTYTESDQTLTNKAGSCTTGGTMYYYTKNYTTTTAPTFSTSSNWSTTFPTAKGNNAGTYYLWYYCYVSDTTNNKGSNINKALSVTKAIGKATATLSCSNKTYTGSEQTACTCTNGTIGGTYKATNAGTYTASCTGDANHNNPSNKDWTMNKAANSISLTCASNLVFSNSNQNLLSAKSATAGNVYIATTSLTSSNYSSSGGTALSKAQGKASGSYTVYAYTPGNANYGEATASKNCSISCDRNLSTTTVGQSVTYAGKTWTIMSKSGKDVFLGMNGVITDVVGASEVSGKVNTFISNNAVLNDAKNSSCISNEGMPPAETGYTSDNYWIEKEGSYYRFYNMSSRKYNCQTTDVPYVKGYSLKGGDSGTVDEFSASIIASSVSCSTLEAGIYKTSDTSKGYASSNGVITITNGNYSSTSKGQYATRYHKHYMYKSFDKSDDFTNGNSCTSGDQRICWHIIRRKPVITSGSITYEDSQSDANEMWVADAYNTTFNPCGTTTTVLMSPKSNTQFHWQVGNGTNYSKDIVADNGDRRNINIAGNASASCNAGSGGTAGICDKASGHTAGGKQMFNRTYKDNDPTYSSSCASITAYTLSNTTINLHIRPYIKVHLP